MEVHSLTVLLGIVLETMLAACLLAALVLRARRAREEELTARLDRIASEMATDRSKLREQVTALQEEVVRLRHTQRDVAGTLERQAGLLERHVETAAVERGELASQNRALLEGQERTAELVVRTLREQDPEVRDRQRWRTLGHRLERLDAAVDGLQARMLTEIEGVAREAEGLRDRLESGLRPGDHSRDQGAGNDPLSAHQVQAMVKIGELLSEITVGIVQGKEPVLDLEVVREDVVAHLHRHGMFLPPDVHDELQPLLAVLLADGDRFYVCAGDGVPRPRSDKGYFAHGAPLPADLFAAASPEGRRHLRVVATALDLIQCLQERLVDGGQNEPAAQPVQLRAAAG